ncbi:hypothetical protein [Horticoccus sp. 23ND18S-11]|uniref:hypothetical protein n=1 Tax=Horticoccus sp. 23ND18S-11 TaxID=3391832 RepID=UPI0039C8C286
MCASPFRLLRAGPPPPKVAFLSDALFFTRSVPVAREATPVEAATQAELALESLSPFPLAQLYYGWFWAPGAESALVFGSYRRRFTGEQVAAWDGAELVLPAFCAVLGARMEPATTVILSATDGLTAVHWEEASVPARVIHAPLLPDATEDARAQAREALLRDVGGSKKVIDLVSPLTAEPATSDREVVFRGPDFVSRLSASAAAALDVRDKTELAALRGARQRDVLLWRIMLGAAAALLLLVVGEFALIGGREWQKVRTRQYNAQKPLVDKIANIHELTNRIEDLATKRLLPMEMVGQIVGENLERKPQEIQFTRMVADQSRGLYMIIVDGKSNSPAQVTAYETTLKNLPTVQSAEVKFGQVTGERATFTLTVIFKPGSINPIGNTVVSSR